MNSSLPLAARLPASVPARCRDGPPPAEEMHRLLPAMGAKHQCSECNVSNTQYSKTSQMQQQKLFSTSARMRIVTSGDLAACHIARLIGSRRAPQGTGAPTASCEGGTHQCTASRVQCMHQQRAAMLLLLTPLYIGTSRRTRMAVFCLRSALVSKEPAAGAAEPEHVGRVSQHNDDPVDACARWRWSDLARPH